MSNKKNRLRFLHCNTCFSNSVEAKQYLLGLNRPSLYAEPMVLKYGDESNPNIILAIGSVGDGNDEQTNNKVCFVDFSRTFTNTNTISWDVVDADVKSNVKLQPTKTKGEETYNNIILSEDNGLFTYVNAKIDDNKLVFNVNGEANEYELPDTVTGATYEEGELQITLHTRKNEAITISLNQIVEDVISGEENNLLQNNKGLFVYVDVNYDEETDKLTFNDGVNEKKEFSLLSKTQKTFNENTTEFINQQNQTNSEVKTFISGQTTANDKFTSDIKRNTVLSAKTKSVENTIETSDDGTTIKSNVILSNSEGNVIKIEENGVFAKVELTYDNLKNELTFTTSNGSKTIELTDHSIVTDGKYDSENQEIVLTITLDNEEKTTSEIRIPVSDLIDIYKVGNTTESPIKLEMKKVDDVETIYGTLNLSEEDDNLLELVKTGDISSLYAKGHADSIKIDWKTINENGEEITENITVQESVDNLKSDIQDKENKLQDLSKELEKINNAVGELTDFGYTDE